MPSHKALHFALSALLLLFPAACGKRPAAFCYQNTPAGGWEAGDTLHYHIDSLRHGGSYRLALGLRTSAATPYPFQSIWLAVRQQWHAPDTLFVDTIECKLTDSKGDVTGNGVSLYTYTQELRNLRLGDGASAEISVMHIMRREIIHGIVDVGIRLDKES